MRLRWGHRSRLAELPWPIANAGPSGRGQYFQALVKIKKKKKTKINSPALVKVVLLSEYGQRKSFYMVNVKNIVAIGALKTIIKTNDAVEGGENV